MTEYGQKLARIQAICFAMVCVLTSMLCAEVETSPSAVVFKDRTAELGLPPQNTAACWVDLDNDGWVDLCTSSGLWKNNAGKGFTKFADAVGSGVVAADFDNDGFADLFGYFQGGPGPNQRLYRNDAGKGLVEFKLPELPKCVSMAACWGDFNGDGFVDLYIGGEEDWNANITYPDMILINNKGESFQLAWSETRYRARGVTACDFDRDGDLDIYVSNYRLQPNILWLNDGEGQFKDVTAEYNAVATSPGFHGGHSIGSAWGDFDNDGNFDLFAGNFAHQGQPESRFLRNLGPKKNYTFDDLGPCGVQYQESYASPAAGDYDNDGDLDLFFTTVYAGNYPVLFRNEGNFKFSDATASANLAGLAPTCQTAWADFDNDGNLDLMTAGKLFVNQGGSGNRWLEVRLNGDGRAVNRSAIGAQVRIKLKDRILARQVEAGTGGLGNQNDLTLHFGLGQYAGPVNLEILWPNGRVQTVRRVKTDRLIVINFKVARGIWQR